MNIDKKVAEVDKCPKCGWKRVEKYNVAMPGKRGIWGMWTGNFEVFACERCGFSEFYYKSKSRWKI